MSSGRFHHFYKFGDFVFERERRVLSRNGDEIPLTPKVFETLRLLVEAEGHAVARETFLSTIWPNTAVGETSLARNISLLRQHLGRDSIVVVAKFGYRLTLPVILDSASVAILGDPNQASLPPATHPPSLASPQLRMQPSILPRALESRYLGIAPLAIGVISICAFAAFHFAGSQIRHATWTDPQTGLEWAARDNGSNVNRQQAIDYCRNLQLDGKSDWRLPTIAELQTLYDPATSTAGI